MRQCRGTAEDVQASMRTWAIGLFATEALDRLSSTLQHLDAVGGSLETLVSDRGVLHEFQAHT
eukprot:2787396-Alexandrium_andersonii.AAC.1